MIFIGMSLAFALSTAPSESAPERRARELDEVARVATVMIDGDLCQRIMTPRALERMRTPDPRDRWAAGDNFDVHHEPYIRTKKTLMRLARLVPYPCDVNLWMPFSDRPDRIQILIRNVHELSQFWPWGALDQPMIPEMKQVLDSGARVTVRKKPGMLSVRIPGRSRSRCTRAWRRRGARLPTCRALTSGCWNPARQRWSGGSMRSPTRT
ncbi:MAG: hypothetical protein DMG07_28515 [Acidobacteria bacterium]|nr:MAG: hypothetical protein DMG07_28515 [Acidobacteriota bacterium]